MRRQRYGKIIVTGSLVGLIGAPFSGYYSASKHAIEGFFKSLRFEIKKFNLHVSVLEPGFFKSKIWQTLQYVPPTITGYAVTQKKMFHFLRDAIENAPAPDPVADTVLKLVNSKTPVCRGIELF
jgi:short-subunit dehydrogenase